MSQRGNQSLNPSQGSSFRLKVAYLSGTLVALGLALAGIIYWQQDSELALSYFEGTFEQALEESLEQDRLCFVQFSTDYCYPCHGWIATLRAEPDLAQLISNQYIPYRVDPMDVYSGGRQLALRYRIETFPTLLITDSEGREITRIAGEIEEKYLREVLQQHAVLRIPPPRPSAPDAGEVIAIMNQQMKVDTAFGAEGRSFGLLLAEYPEFIQARREALTQSRVWNRGIWLQNTRNGAYQLVLGHYDSRREARITARFLEVWENQVTKVIRLEDQPLVVRMPRLHPTR